MPAEAPLSGLGCTDRLRPLPSGAGPLEKGFGASLGKGNEVAELLSTLFPSRTRAKGVPEVSLVWQKYVRFRVSSLLMSPRPGTTVRDAMEPTSTRVTMVTVVDP
jgi:hypothetical protein